MLFLSIYTVRWYASRTRSSKRRNLEILEDFRHWHEEEEVEDGV